MKKAVLFIATFLVIALVGVYFSLGSLVKTAVQKGGTRALGVETTLGPPRRRSGGLNELAVRNPPGFTEEYFLQMRGARVVVPLSSLTSERVEVTLLSLDGFTLDLESKGLGNSNYGVLLENLERLGDEGGGQPEPEPSVKGKRKAFVIKKILITDVTARARFATGGSRLGIDTSIDEVLAAFRVE